MKKIFLIISQSLLSTCILILLLEGAFWVLGFPQGTSDFIERVVFQQDLKLKKKPGQFRIFVYGESTVHGAGYAPTSSPVKWLDAYLKDFLPTRNIQVINFGRLGEGSADIAQAFSDTLQYKPDLAIFYLGHNTFMPQNRVVFEREKAARLKNRLKQWLHKSRLISAVVREAIKQKIRRHPQKTQDTMGDGRIETIPQPFGADSENITLPGSALFQDNVRFLKQNVERIQRAGQRSHVPVLFMKPVCNLKDYAPNLALHLKPLTADALASWEQWYKLGQESAEKKDDQLALEYYEKAFAIDPTFADLSFSLGQLYFKKGELGKARSFYENARDNDVVIGRAPRDILRVFEDLSRQEKILYFDTEAAFIPRVPGGILGWPIIEDNVHFSIEGQAVAGRALAEEIAKNGWIAPRSEWRFDRERSAEQISKELGVTDETIFWNYCSVISFLRHRYDKRLEFAQRAQRLFPDHPVALRQLAWGYWLTGEKDKALDVYKRLGERDASALATVFNAHAEVKHAYEALTETPANV